MKYLLVIALIILSPNSLSKDTSFFATPLASRLAGVGFIYGAAAGGTNLYNDKIDILIGKTFGKINGEALSINRVPLFFTNLNLSLFLGNVNEANYETTYARGFNESLIVNQKISANVISANLEMSFFEEKFKVFITKAKSTTKFKGYEDEDGTIIPFSLSTLHDIESDITSVGLLVKLQNGKGKLAPSIMFKPKITSISGRTAQSDIRIFDYITSAQFPVLTNSKVVLYLQGSHSSVTKKDLTSPDVVDGKCSTVSNATQKSKCLQLESDLKEYIRASNNNGTAMPLGGSRGLRSYRELRFKAAHNQLSGIELQTLLWDKPELYIAPFVELGHSSDSGSELLKHARYSAGLALRVYVKDIPIRLESAFGNEGTEYFLSAGLPW